MKKHAASILLCFLICQTLMGQDSVHKKSDSTTAVSDISSLLDAQPRKVYVEAAFKASRVVTSQSIEMVKPGVLMLIIQHRFGNLNSGSYEFYGLDQATIRLGLDYGIGRNLTVGIGRGSYKKESDAYLKYRLVQQAEGPGASPLSVIAFGSITYQGIHPSDPTHHLTAMNRMSYVGQLVIGRKINSGLSLQVAPTIVHRNLVPVDGDPNDTYALELGARIKLTRRISLNADYCIVFNKDQSVKTYNPLSIGFDIETGGHVFQLHFTNAIGMNERAFITETTNDWGKGAIQFGFNISRAFQVKKRK